MARITRIEHRKSAPPRAEHPDVVIARLAARQHDVVASRQLLAAGITEDAIRHRIAVKRLRRIHAGVYAVGTAALSRHGRYLAAVLACGDGAVVSHRSAAAQLGLRSPSETLIDVTIARGGSRRRSGIVVHTTRCLGPADLTVVEGVPSTSVARTLVDLAAVLPARQLDRALEQALILRVFDGAALDAALSGASGRAGVGILRRLLANLADAPDNVRNQLERLFLALLRDAGLPEPVVNALVCGHEVDFHWPAQRLIVETDGRETHDTPLAFERDRQRDLDLELAGWHVLRITWRQLNREPDRVAALLRARFYSGSRSQ